MAGPVRDREPIGLLWLIDSLTLGGAEALAAEFARAHDRARWRLTVGCLKSIDGNPFAAALAAAGVPLVELEARHLRDLGAFRRLRALLAERRVGLVHAHLAYASIWGTFAGGLAGVPAVATLHVLPGAERLASREGLRRRLLVAALGRGARRVLAVSAAVRAAWVAAGVPAERVEVVPNGVDVERFARPRAPGERERLRAALGWPPAATVVLTVGALRPEKGTADLLAAFAALAPGAPALRLAVAGDGPERGALEAAARAAGVAERVSFLGLRRDVDDLLAAADVFALASRVEAYPTVLLEALAAGVPVVATATGGVPEIVIEGTGLLAPAGAPAELAAALGRLAAEPELARALAARGRARARAEFSLARWCARLDAVYDAALAGAPAAADAAAEAGR